MSTTSMDRRSPQYDVVIRGGTVLDGTGGPPRTADVAVSGGVVTEVGRVTGTAARQIDANGAMVTPGFVDIHTHYDGQATWDERLLPSSGHGVTTVVMGNCGVGFAPVRPQDHDQLIELMEGVEDIPGAALHEGLDWEWEDFSGYLDALERRAHDIDLAAQVPHGPLRLYVMGQRGADREPATPEEITEMGRLAAQAVLAGALGFTTSRTLNHRTSRGEPTPTLTAARDELVGIAQGLGSVGAGVLQVVSDFADFEEELGTLRAMMEASGRPLSISLAQNHRSPLGYRRILDVLSEANADGLEMRGQVAARGIGVLLGLASSVNPLARCPAFKALGELGLAQLVARLSEPGVRDQILSEYNAQRPPLDLSLDRVFVLGDPPDYEPLPSASVAAQAKRANQAPAEFFYDLLLRDGGQALLYLPILNYADANLDAVGEMLSHPHTVPGLSDGGAHVGTICDASFPTTLLAHWGRDRQGAQFDWSWLVRRQSADTAAAVGLGDRGVLAPGYRADINVIDPDEVGMSAPRLVFDLPAQGKRLLQDGRGYRHTLVAGTEVYADGRPTGALPGRLIRGARP
ncbi:MAG: N-acyl-D-amino-acid deacylase family protein [Acidimicrobiales bacterium]